MTNEDTATEQEAEQEQSAPEQVAAEIDAQVQQRALVPVATKEEIADLYTWGKMMVASGFFKDARSEAAAAVKILMGRALGFDMISSMTGLHIVEGRPTLGANLMAHAVKRSGKYTYRVIEHDEQHCVIHFFERVEAHGEADAAMQKIGESSFTIDDAKRAGLVKAQSNWEKWPRNMVFARALSNGVRWHCPDVFSGTAVYTPEELRPEMEITEDGEPVYIEAGFVPEEPPQAQPEQRQQQRAPARGRREAQPEAPRQQRPAQRPARKTKDLTLSDVGDLQSLMTWQREQFKNTDGNRVAGLLGVTAVGDIAKKYTTNEDWREAALLLMAHFEPEQYAQQVESDEEMAARAAALYEAEEQGPEEAGNEQARTEGDHADAAGEGAEEAAADIDAADQSTDGA